jgi:hypothetical protein
MNDIEHGGNLRRHSPVAMGLCLMVATLAASSPTHGQFVTGPQDRWAPREAYSEPAPACCDRRMVAQAATSAQQTAEQAASPAATGGYTPEQIAEMINNPLGSLWLLNVQSTATWFSGTLVDRAEPLGRAQIATLIQPVLSMQLTPGIRWLSRPIIPINSFELPKHYTPRTDQFGPDIGSITFGRTTGLGDIEWMNYLATNEGVKPPDIFGIGVGLMMDTATSDALGTGKWAAGPAAVVVHLGDKWMYGVVAQHFWSFAGDARRNDINLTVLQPILRYALNQEVGIGVMPNWNYNWETRRWTQLFVGLGYDAMIDLGPVPTQVGIEFHYNLAKNDLLNPQWQVRLVFTPVVPAPAWAGRPLFGN